jgi:hypothetical protein
LFIKKFTDVYEFFLLGWEVRGKGVTWEDLSMEEFFIEEEIFYEGGAGFPSII